jgi:hypothetical protein
MTVRQPRYSKEEFARRGNEIYETQVRSQVEEGNHGKIVAIDIETGAFEVADTPMVAVDRLYEREPDAQPWVIRIGHRAVFRFGSRRTSQKFDPPQGRMHYLIESLLHIGFIFWKRSSLSIELTGPTVSLIFHNLNGMH